MRKHIDSQDSVCTCGVRLEERGGDEKEGHTQHVL